MNGDQTMNFFEYGQKSAPVIVMLTGSFCPAEALAYLYLPLSEHYRVIVPEYNGHAPGSGAFTTRQQEAAGIAAYIKEQGIGAVALLYGQSMGAEVGIELQHQLTASGIEVKHALYDGAPCIRLSKPYKAFMYFKFKTMIDMMRKRSVEDVMQWKFLNKFTNGDTESLRTMIEGLAKIAPILTNETIRNETECCYTFDFPSFSEAMQEKMQFLYGSGEKAYGCRKYVDKAYPKAKITVFEGYGHMTYSARHTEDYITLMKKWIKS